MKHLYFVHAQDYRIVVRASNEDEARQIVKDWYFDNVSSFDNTSIDWIVELCDNDKILE